MLKTLVIVIVTAVLAGCSSAPQKSTSPSSTYVKSGAHECLALTMYWEARGEGDKGMVAVGSVVLNRVAHPQFPSTVCGVVHQGGEKPPCQFSWWCDGRGDYPAERNSWARSLSLADDLLTDRPRDPSKGALFFHNDTVKTPRNRQRTASIGRHVFYK